MFNTLWALVAMNLRSLPQRLGTASVIVVGIAGVVAVLVSALAMSQAFHRTLADGGRADRALLLRAGTDTEASSSLTREETDQLLTAPGLARDAAGRPLASRELVTDVRLPRRDDGSPSNALLRGVEARARELRPELKLVEGRLFQAGTRELIVGRGALGRFGGLAAGQPVRLRNETWTVTGVFTSGGSVHESALLADVDVVAASLGRQGYSSVLVQLEDAGAFERFAAAVAQQTQKRIEAQRESDYFAIQSQTVSRLIRGVGSLVAVVMAIGAVFAALNSMHAAVARRVREIATLRAVGFKPGVVLLSVLVEALALALLGGALGATLTWLALNGNEISTMGSGVSQVVFALRVDAATVAKGLFWALAIGLVGGLFPALTAARLPVVEALRQR